MNKRLLIIVVAIIAALVIIGAIALTYNTMPQPPSGDDTSDASQTNTPSTPTNNPEPQPQPQPQPQPEPQPPANTTPGQYKDYSPGVIAQTPGTKILFFHAPWCPQCRALEASILEGNIPSGVTIFKVDYDSNQALRQKYGVTIQTTLVLVDDQGNFVAKYVAYDQPTLQAVIDNLLP